MRRELFGARSIASSESESRDAMRGSDAVTRFALEALPGERAPTILGQLHAISPDGLVVVYVASLAGKTQQLWRRPMNELDATAISCTDSLDACPHSWPLGSCPWHAPCRPVHTQYPQLRPTTRRDTPLLREACEAVLQRRTPFLPCACRSVSHRLQTSGAQLGGLSPAATCVCAGNEIEAVAAAVGSTMSVARWTSLRQ